MVGVSDIGSTPIGQDDAVTAQQVLDMVNTVATGGVFVPPRLVRGHGGRPTGRSTTPRRRSHAPCAVQEVSSRAHHDDGAGGPGRHGGDRRRARVHRGGQDGHGPGPRPRARRATSPGPTWPPSPASPPPRTRPCRPSWCSSEPRRSTAASWPPRCSPRSCGTRCTATASPRRPGGGSTGGSSLGRAVSPGLAHRDHGRHRTLRATTDRRPTTIVASAGKTTEGP